MTILSLLDVFRFRRKLLFAGLTAFALVAAMPAWQAAYAQSAAPTGSPAAVQRHNDALALEQRGDLRGALVAFIEAAENGYPPAQRRLGEIYDSGNTAVERNYAESIRWYQKAREGGEDIPPPKSPMPALNLAR